MSCHPLGHSATGRDVPPEPIDRSTVEYRSRTTACSLHRNRKLPCLDKASGVWRVWRSDEDRANTAKHGRWGEIQRPTMNFSSPSPDPHRPHTPSAASGEEQENVAVPNTIPCSLQIVSSHDPRARRPRAATALYRPFDELRPQRYPSSSRDRAVIADIGITTDRRCRP